MVADLSAELGEAAATSLDPLGRFARCDVTLRADIDAIAERCVALCGTPDIAANNAGTTHVNQPLLDVDDAGSDHVYAVNVKSIFHMTHTVAPLMLQRGRGVMLNVNSTAGLRPRPGFNGYSGSEGMPDTATNRQKISSRSRSVVCASPRTWPPQRSTWQAMPRPSAPAWSRGSTAGARSERRSSDHWSRLRPAAVAAARRASTQGSEPASGKRDRHTRA